MADIPVNASSRFVVVDVVVNGQVNFDFDFRADDVDDLKAVYTTAAGVDTALSGGTDFTASGLGTADGGAITLTSFTATVAGSKVTIYSDIVIDRENDYQRDVFADDLNREQDTIFMILQELARDIGRSIKARLDGGVVTIGRVFVSDGVGGYMGGPSADDIAGAQGYAQAAAGSAIDADNSADAAAASALLSQRFATYPEDTDIPGTGGLRSAFHWAQKAAAVVVGGVQAALAAATLKATPVNADRVTYLDSANGNAIVYGTWTNVKSFLKTYFDTLYPPINNAALTGSPTSTTPATSDNSTRIATTSMVQAAIAANAPQLFAGPYTEVTLAGSTTKQNTTGKTIYVAVRAAGTGGGVLGTAKLFVGASPVHASNPQVDYGNSVGTAQSDFGFAKSPVSPNEYYSYTNTGAASPLLKIYEKA